ncbi:MAG: phosphatase PAP2 family protein [Ferruginibacter sp.]
MNITHHDVEEKRLPPIAVSAYGTLLRFFAQFFSYVFHPLFIPLYVAAFLAFVSPTYFAGFSELGKKSILLQVAINAVGYPAIAIWLLKRLGFIDSIFLRTQKDRIIPYMTSMIFYFWTQYVLRELNYVPRILVAFMFGVFISTSAALIANIYYKISMHAIGMGGMLGLFLVIMQQNTMLMTWPLAMAFLLAGLVCTSRMIVSDHRPKEIYAGLIVGFACQLVGAAINL